MKMIHNISALRRSLNDLGECALVPTMGNLHEGHLALVKHAKSYGLPIVASIFVNRLQFLPHEDFDQYPRTLAADSEKLKSAGCDLIFAPTEQELYPLPQTFKVVPDPQLTDILEGHFRPGFFTGVATVVMKLFSIVQPKVAVFGKKDYQQWRVIRRMVEQFALPIDITGLDTVRAPDGLALSSRNAYLSQQERAAATTLQQSLKELIDAYQAAPQQREAIEARAMDQLTAQGWQPDYLTIREQHTLQHPTTSSDRLVALGAARLGRTRLIDNLEF
jgi:pantoate--beta-alanine ligase